MLLSHRWLRLSRVLYYFFPTIRAQLSLSIKFPGGHSFFVLGTGVLVVSVPLSMRVRGNLASSYPARSFVEPVSPSSGVYRMSPSPGSLCLPSHIVSRGRRLPICFAVVMIIFRFSLIRNEGHCHRCRNFSVGSLHPGQCVSSPVHFRIYPVGSQSCMILHG